MSDSVPNSAPQLPRVEYLAFRFATVLQVRIARPTHQLEKVTAFYREGLGLPELDRFKNHAGYSGVILGLPGHTYHLELTQHAAATPLAAPPADNLLVFYIGDLEELQTLRKRLERTGYACVQPENPYWLDNSVTFADPDGWRVVLCKASGI